MENREAAAVEMTPPPVIITIEHDPTTGGTTIQHPTNAILTLGLLRLAEEMILQNSRGQTKQGGKLIVPGFAMPVRRG